MNVWTVANMINLIINKQFKMELPTDIITLIGCYCDIESLIDLSMANHRLHKHFHQQETIKDLCRYKSFKIIATFKELIHNYDIRYLTKRCLNYWSLTECIFWYYKNNLDYDSLIKNYPNAKINLTTLLKYACQMNDHNLIDVVFNFLEPKNNIFTSVLNIYPACVLAASNIKTTQYLYEKTKIAVTNGITIYGYEFKIHKLNAITTFSLLENWQYPEVIKNEALNTFLWILENSHNNDAFLEESTYLSGDKEKISLIFKNNKYEHHIIDNIIRSGNAESLDWYINETGFTGIFTENMITAVLESGNINLVKHIEHMKWSDYIDIHSLLCNASSSGNLNMVKLLVQHEQINLKYKDLCMYDLIQNKHYPIIEYLLHTCSEENTIKSEIYKILCTVDNITMEDVLSLIKLFSYDCIPWKYMLFNNIDTLSPEIIEYIAEFCKTPSLFTNNYEVQNFTDHVNNGEFQNFKDYIINSNNGKYINSILGFNIIGSWDALARKYFDN
jgi:hypothetical protein